MTPEQVFFDSEIILKIDVLWYEWVNYSNLLEVDLQGIRKETFALRAVKSQNAVASRVLLLRTALAHKGLLPLSTHHVYLSFL